MRLFDPFLLRRLVKADERQATALESIAASLAVITGVYSPHAAPVFGADPEEEDPEIDVSYASNHSTWEAEEIERQRRRPAPRTR